MRSWRWLFGALLALLPLFLWRASLESSLWIDETYSLVLTTYPVERVVELTAADSHPPLYYLALKTWLKLGRRMGLEGILWARSINVLVWVAAALVVAWGCRRLLGEEAGNWVTLAVAASAASGLVARDLRSYAFATPALTLAFFTLLGLSSLSVSDRRRWWLWSGFVLTASLAVWSHLLAALALAALLLVWLVLELPRTRFRVRLLLEAGAASMLVIGGFLAWLPKVVEQIRSVAAGSTDWMTAPNLGNWFLTFTFWLPFGRIGYLGEPLNRLLLPLGIAAAVLPFAAALIALRRPRPEGSKDLLDTVMVLGLSSAVVFVSLLWILDRFGLAPIFDAPRYPNLTANLWNAGLAALALSAARRLGWKSWARTTVLLGPWIVCGLVGQIYLGTKEASWGLEPLKPQIAPLLPKPGEPIYVMPSELLPYYRRSLAEFEPRGIELLPCMSPIAAVTVVDLNFWKKLDRPRDHLARTLIETKQLSSSVEARAVPEPQGDYHLYRLSALQPEGLAGWCRTGLTPRGREVMAGAVSFALPEDQPPTPDWSYLEVNSEGGLYRWGLGPTSRVRFDRGVSAGSYVLHLAGWRSEFPQEEVDLRLDWQGEPLAVRPLKPGHFELSLSVNVSQRGSAPWLEVSHPTWRPADVSGSTDKRQLSFLFLGAWLKPAEEDTVP